MKRWFPSAAEPGRLLLGGLVLLPLLALAVSTLIGSRGPLSKPDPSILQKTGWAALPGMGATILPRWTLSNYDPRLEGTGRGDQWPVPAGISYAPDRSTSLTCFPRSAADEPLVRLLLNHPSVGER